MTLAAHSPTMTTPVVRARWAARRSGPLLVVGVLATVPLAVAGLAVDRDCATDIAAALGRAISSTAGFAARVSWLLVAALAVVSVLHYVAAAAASRAAAGAWMPPKELLAVQLAASAANRLTPAGLGGAGVLGRFFMRRGGLSGAQSGAAVSSLTALGGLADVGAFAVLVATSVTLGVGGAGTEVTLLVRRLLAIVPGMHSPGTVVVVVLTIGLASAVLCIALRGTRTTMRARVAGAIAGFATSVGALLRHPMRVAALMGASAATTLMLAAGFSSAAVLGPTHVPAAAIIPMMIGYMAAAAAGNAVPTPGGIGTTDAAFVAVLVAAHASAGAALVSVITFRVITFWAPATIGILAARTLRRAGAL